MQSLVNAQVCKMVKRNSSWLLCLLYREGGKSSTVESV